MHQTTCTRPGCHYVTVRGDECNFHRAGYTERLVVPELGPCHEWAGKIDHRGYGYVNMTGHKNPIGAHRVAYSIEGGPLIPGHDVRHRCDNPPCIRGSHLLTGTRQDNVNDAVERDRVQYGEQRPNHKLTDATVTDARERYAVGAATCDELATEYGITRRTMLKALTGETWKRTPGPVADGSVGRRGERHCKALLTADNVRAIRAAYAAGGVTMLALAQQHEVSRGTVDALIHRRSWAHVE